MDSELQPSLPWVSLGGEGGAQAPGEGGRWQPLEMLFRNEPLAVSFLAVVGGRHENDSLLLINLVEESPFADAVAPRGPVYRPSLKENHHARHCSRVKYRGSPERVFEAIATQEGLSAWWTRDTEAQPKVGSVAVFRFPGSSTVFRMAIKALDRARRIEWHCIGDHEEWKDTRLTFELKPAAAGNQTIVRFKHAGWRSAEGWMGTCSYTWAHVLARLRLYLETGDRSPYFAR